MVFLWIPAMVAILLAVLVIGGGTLLGRRRGYNLGGKVVARCSAGHLFTTLWIPGVSFKAIRLGRKRFQHCPVGDHWAWVTAVPAGELTDEERAEAALYDDGRVP